MDIELIIQLVLWLFGFLFLWKIAYRFKVAYWGHGINHQEDIATISNRIKALLIRRCDWWFAYTENVKKFLVSKDYPGSKITVCQNTLDINSMIGHFKSIDNDEIFYAKKVLKIDSDRIAIYSGALYPEKNIEFLLKACILMKKRIKDFHILILGAGPDQKIVEIYASENDWIHYLGARFGREKALFFSISTLLLNPGLVGLITIDSFAYETPLITTTYPYHSPEIEYIENDSNGVITSYNIKEYASKVVDLFESKEIIEKLKKGCVNSQKKYTMERMISNFEVGIKSCLAQNINS